MRANVDEIQPKLKEIIDKTLHSELPFSDLKAGDFVLVCSSEENMQNYIRFGKFKGIEKLGYPEKPVFHPGYNINIIKWPEVEILRAKNQIVFAGKKDHFYRLNEEEIPLVLNLLETAELAYLNQCLKF